MDLEQRRVHERAASTVHERQDYNPEERLHVVRDFLRIQEHLDWISQLGLPVNTARRFVASCAARHTYDYCEVMSNPPARAGDVKFIRETVDLLFASIEDEDLESADLPGRRRALFTLPEFSNEYDQGAGDSAVGTSDSILVLMYALEFWEDSVEDQIVATARAALTKCFQIDQNLPGACFEEKEMDRQRLQLTDNRNLSAMGDVRRWDQEFGMRLIDSAVSIQLRSKLIMHGFLDPFDQGRQ